MKDARRNGRPPLDEHDPSVRLSFRVSPREYDALYQRASRDRVTLSDLIRRRVQRPEPDDEREDDR